MRFRWIISLFLSLALPFLIGCQRSQSTSDGRKQDGSRSGAKSKGASEMPDEVVFSGDKSLREVKTDALEEGEGGLVRVKGEAEPFTGRAVDASSGYRQQVETWYQGRLHGAQTHWNREGNRFKQVIWRNGQRHGFTTLWYDNGLRMQSTEFRDGVKEGKNARWYPNQVKKSEEHFAGGKLQGVAMEWGEKGRQMIKVVYESGREVSRSRWVWANDRQIAKVINWEKGEIVSETFYKYSFRGYLLSATTMRSGVKQGLETRWHPDGKKMMESSWSGGKLDGVMRAWHRNGKLRTESRWKSGRPVFKKAWGMNGAQVKVPGYAEDGAPN